MYATMSKMKQTLVLWLCVFVMGCPNPHTAEHLDNAAISAQHDIALAACVDAAIASIQVGEPHDKVQSEYDACAAAADAKFGKK